MQGLVSILPSPFYEQVETLWKELEDEIGLQGFITLPFPHFTWQIAENYNPQYLDQTVAEIAKTTPPIPVRTAGIGLFTGQQPVVFIRLGKNAAMIELHNLFWERVQGASQGLSPLYSPKVWTPHIILAYRDVDRENITPIITRLAFRPFTWEMVIDTISLFQINKDGSGDNRVKSQFKLSGPVTG